MAIEKFIESIPVGPLAIVALSGSKALGETVDAYISDWRSERIEEMCIRDSFCCQHAETASLSSCQQHSYHLFFNHVPHLAALNISNKIITKKQV